MFEPTWSSCAGWQAFGLIGAMVDYLYEPYEMNEPDGFEPLELDDEDYDEDEYDYYDDPYANDADDEYDDYDEYELGGFDDLKPFGSFSDGLGWDDALF